MNEILVIENLNKVFVKKGHRVNALAGIDMVVTKGDYIAIQGPSGSGKTTLLNMLGCLDQPSLGRVVIDGIDITKVNGKQLSKVRGTKIGFIFQAFNLLPILNSVENVALPMELKNMSKKNREDKALDLLELVGLSERMTHRPYELSAGEQQRVAIARALANDPTIVLADEPTGNLDSKTGRQIMDLLGKLNKEMGTTIIVVTHDDNMARRTKRIIYLKDGKVRKMEDQSGLYDIAQALDLPQRVAKRLLGSGYDNLEKILNMTEEDLQSIKNLKKKDARYILASIEEYNEMSNN
jgi:putative ABC transport system ATP-binding protein